jgi:hypothetical protein
MPENILKFVSKETPHHALKSTVAAGICLHNPCQDHMISIPGLLHVHPSRDIATMHAIFITPELALKIKEWGCRKVFGLWSLESVPTVLCMNCGSKLK